MKELLSVFLRRLALSLLLAALGVSEKLKDILVHGLDGEAVAGGIGLQAGYGGGSAFDGGDA